MKDKENHTEVTNSEVEKTIKPDESNDQLSGAVDRVAKALNEGVARVEEEINTTFRSQRPYSIRTRIKTCPSSPQRRH